MSEDVLLVTGWWAVLFLIGAAALPFTRKLFLRWWDQGYLFSKAIGLCGVTFFTWYLGSLKMLAFTRGSIIVSLLLVFFAGVVAQHFNKTKQMLASFFRLFGVQIPLATGKRKGEEKQMISWKRMVILEVFFFFCLLFWSYVKAFEPDIRGLEKFMDYGFSQTIANTLYFPPPDMWYAGGTINYYYFGHAMMAMLSKLSLIDLAYGYNLMLATLFALCFTMSFSITLQLTAISFDGVKVRKRAFWLIVAGLLGAWLVTLAGNMQTIYAFTKGYHSEDTPPPFWQNVYPPDQFLAKLPETLNTYWYANATRFIPFTIHEFPSYSFVVSDNHGHVLSIPFALLAIASLLTMFAMRQGTYIAYALYGMLGGILLMTNALDGLIYMGLFAVLLAAQPIHGCALFSYAWIREKGIRLGVAAGAFVVAALPFLLNFTSFASGLAVNCPPKFLENTKIGPIIFETVDKCQKSPLWMIWLLWGFFFFCGIVFLLKLWSKRKTILQLEKFLIVIFLYSVGLIFFAEFFYFKDIYPAHFRSNTMFKLGYQAFMMCSMLSAYVIIHTIRQSAGSRQLSAFRKWGRRIFFLLLLPQLFLVSIFPFFSIRSYFGGLQVYKGLYGLQWFEREFPDDYQAMLWLKKQVSSLGQNVERHNSTSFLKDLSQTDNHVHDNFFTSHLERIPVILEADGDSYTDYGRMSAFAGVPTVIGWGVHEWLWRGTYDVVSPRKEEVLLVYEGIDDEKRLDVLAKYNIQYIVVGQLERQKFLNLNDQAIMQIGREVFRSGNTVIYERSQAWY
jgi:uncharacterized membrane protein